MVSVDRFIVEFDKGLRTLFTGRTACVPIPMPACRMRPWMKQRRRMPPR